MATPDKMEIITIEEHYWDKETSSHFGPSDAMRGAPHIMERLFDYSALRIKEMDEAGIDVQVISHGAPSAQKLPADGAAALVRGANDRLNVGFVGCGGRMRSHIRHLVARNKEKGDVMAVAVNDIWDRRKKAAQEATGVDATSTRHMPGRCPRRA